MNKSKQNISILSISLTSGGAEKVISLLLKKLKTDYNVTLVLLYNMIHFPIPEEVEIEILCNDNSNKSFFLKILDFFGSIRKYYFLIRKKNIDISISFLALPNFINGIVASRKRNLKTIISERGFPSDNVSSKLSLIISKIFYPIFYNRCNKLFSNSVHINKDLKDNFGIKIPMEVIYNPIILPKKTIEPSSLDNKKEQLRIITVGSLTKRKNHIMIFRAIQNTTNFNLTILGGGPLKKKLLNKKRIKKLGNKVCLAGKVKNVNEYLLQSDCFVLTSFTEGFPNVLLEAMAVGLPCISTNCLSGPLELLNENKEVNINNGEFYEGKYGFLINNDDHVGLKRALKYLRNNPEIRVKYAHLSLERSKAYHLDNIYSKFYDFLNN